MSVIVAKKEGDEITIGADGQVTKHGYSQYTEKAEQDMEGIYTSHIPIDEAPDAYKPIDVIQNEIHETVEIVDTINPVLNIKA